MKISSLETGSILLGREVDSLVFEIVYFLKDPHYNLFMDVQQEIHRRILERGEFPQQKNRIDLVSSAAEGA